MFWNSCWWVNNDVQNAGKCGRMIGLNFRVLPVSVKIHVMKYETRHRQASYIHKSAGLVSLCRQKNKKEDFWAFLKFVNQCQNNSAIKIIIKDKIIYNKWKDAPHHPFGLITHIRSSVLLETWLSGDMKDINCKIPSHPLNFPDACSLLRNLKWRWGASRISTGPSNSKLVTTLSSNLSYYNNDPEFITSEQYSKLRIWVYDIGTIFRIGTIITYFQNRRQFGRGCSGQECLRIPVGGRSSSNGLQGRERASFLTPESRQWDFLGTGRDDTTGFSNYLDRQRSPLSCDSCMATISGSNFIFFKNG